MPQCAKVILKKKEYIELLHEIQSIHWSWNQVPLTKLMHPGKVYANWIHLLHYKQGVYFIIVLWAESIGFSGLHTWVQKERVKLTWIDLN